jgi:hypothetical protein
LWHRYARDLGFVGIAGEMLTPIVWTTTPPAPACMFRKVNRATARSNEMKGSGMVNDEAHAGGHEGHAEVLSGYGAPGAISADAGHFSRVGCLISARPRSPQWLRRGGMIWVNLHCRF